MVELLEKWGNLPEGSTELIKNETLKNATKEQLQKFAEELGEEVAKEHILKETQFDLDRIRWPTKVSVLEATGVIPGPAESVYDIPAVMDRMGRLYFRIQDVKEEWFVPGFSMNRKAFNKESGLEEMVEEVILEATPLFSGDQKIAVQVTSAPAKNVQR